MNTIPIPMPAQVQALASDYAVWKASRMTVRKQQEANRAGAQKSRTAPTPMMADLPPLPGGLSLARCVRGVLATHAEDMEWDSDMVRTALSARGVEVSRCRVSQALRRLATIGEIDRVRDGQHPLYSRRVKS